MADQHFVVGDTLKPAVAYLEYEDDDGNVLPVDLSGKTVLFKMTNTRAPYAVKVAEKPATIITDGTAGERAKVMYEWAAIDVDVKGIYAAWFIVVDGGAREHYPKGYDYFIHIHPVDGSQIDELLV